MSAYDKIVIENLKEEKMESKKFLHEFPWFRNGTRGLIMRTGARRRTDK